MPANPENLNLYEKIKANVVDLEKREEAVLVAERGIGSVEFFLAIQPEDVFDAEKYAAILRSFWVLGSATNLAMLGGSKNAQLNSNDGEKKPDILYFGYIDGLREIVFNENRDPEKRFGRPSKQSFDIFVFPSGKYAKFISDYVEKRTSFGADSRMEQLKNRVTREQYECIKAAPQGGLNLAELPSFPKLAGEIAGRKGTELNLLFQTYKYPPK